MRLADAPAGRRPPYLHVKTSSYRCSRAGRASEGSRSSRYKVAQWAVTTTTFRGRFRGSAVERRAHVKQVVKISQRPRSSTAAFRMLSA